tara:strand:- start:11832 stop:12545 length:714 start_codon:yes stop_codon:yes gene_type:complete
MTAPSNNTPIAILNDSYIDAGLLQAGEVADSSQIVIGLRRLTDIINLEQTQGLKLWLNVDTAVPLVQGQGTYTFSPTGDVIMPKPPRAIEAYFLDASGIRRPLNVLSWDDYIRLSQIDQEGTINSYFVDKKQTELSVFFWLIPDATAATGTCHLLLQTQVTNPISVTEEMNFPVEWRIFLRWALADELATGQPQAIMDRCQQRTMYYRELLEGWDVEDASTSFAPDSRSQYYGNRFR